MEAGEHNNVLGYRCIKGQHRRCGVDRSGCLGIASPPAFDYFSSSKNPGIPSMKKLFVLPAILFFLHGHTQIPVALTVSAGTNQVVCPGTAIHLTTLTNGGDGNYTFRWSPAEGLS